MNRLEDYLQKKGDPDAIQALIDSPNFKGSELEKSLHSFEETLKDNLQMEIEKELDEATVEFRESYLREKFLKHLDETDKLQSKLGNMISNIPENSHPIDAIIDDGGISGRLNGNVFISDSQIHEIDYLYQQEDEIDKLLEAREKTLSEIMQADENDGLYDEEHYIDHETIGDPISWDEDVFVAQMIEFNQKSIVSDIIDQSSEILDSEKGDVIEFPDYLLNDSEIVGYPDEEMQNEIYEWVESKLPKFDRLISIKDLGCGRGDFYGYISQSETEFDYIGIDSNPNLISVGRQKYPGINLINDDFLNVNEQSDYTICIGTLNENHGFDKWEYFNTTLNHALNTSNKAAIFVLSANFDGIEEFLDYPIHELVERLPKDLRWEIDYSRFEDIYMLTVHRGGWA